MMARRGNPGSRHRSARGLRLAGGLLVLLALLTLLASVSGAQSLDRALARLLADPHLEGATVGVAVRDLVSGEWMLLHEADTALIPASNMKLVTAAAALEWLGGNHVFYTRLGVRGKIVEGELLGDLVLEGNGDPWFGGRHSPGATPALWAAKLRKLGIRRITGDLVVVERTLDQTYAHPDWERYEPASTVAQEVAALGYRENTVAVTVRPGRQVGRPARLGIDPSCGHVKLVNQIKTVNGKSSGPGFGRATGSNRIEVRGRISRRARARSGGAAVHDPPLFLARVLRRSLERAGITLIGKILRNPRSGSKGARAIAEHRVTVAELITPSLGASDNRVTEILGKAAGAAYTGKVGSWANAGRGAAAIMKRAGATHAGAAYRDGSGLSRMNRLTARQLVLLLGWVTKRPYTRAYADALAYGGEPGTTLKRRFTTGAIASSIRAKTGYLDGVRAISGYLKVGDDRALAFALIVNGSTRRIRKAGARNAMDQLIRSVWTRAKEPRSRPGR